MHFHSKHTCSIHVQMYFLQYGAYSWHLIVWLNVFKSAIVKEGTCAAGIGGFNLSSESSSYVKWIK